MRAVVIAGAAVVTGDVVEAGWLPAVAFAVCVLAGLGVLVWVLRNEARSKRARDLFWGRRGR